MKRKRILKKMVISLSPEEKSNLEQKVTDLKKAKETGNSEDLKSSIESLNTLWSSLASKMYNNNKSNEEPKIKQ